MQPPGHDGLARHVHQYRADSPQALGDEGALAAGRRVGRSGTPPGLVAERPARSLTGKYWLIGDRKR